MPPANSAETPEPDSFLQRGHTFASVTDKISSIVLTRQLKHGWIIGLAISFTLTMVLFFSIAWLFMKGIGIWGVNVPVAWGFAIVNFVWWVGIGHAGTLISAFLLLMHQEWRTSGQEWPTYLQSWAEGHGLHQSAKLVPLLDARLQRRALSRCPASRPLFLAEPWCIAGCLFQLRAAHPPASPVRGTSVWKTCGPSQ